MHLLLLDQPSIPVLPDRPMLLLPPQQFLAHFLALIVCFCLAPVCLAISWLIVSLRSTIIPSLHISLGRAKQHS